MSETIYNKITSTRLAPADASPVLTEAERHRLLVEWNRTERDYPRDKCLHQLFEEQVERTPEAVAAVFEEESLTYRELNIRANRLAHHLHGLGVGPGVLVALCLERSLEMVVAILGTMKAGAAYMPMDPDYPAERVAFMLADANAAVLLTQEALRNKLPPTTANVICLDSDWKVIQQESETMLVTGVTAEDLAYVIYTSGSTGRPKGVMNTHRGICNRLLWMQEAYQLTEWDRLLQKTPFSFDISVWEFFWPLLNGARLIVARPGGHRDNQYLISVITGQRITMLHFVPSMLRRFLQETEVGNCTSLRCVFCGGEALPYDLQETFFNRLPDIPLHNLYGPTEAAVDVTHWICKPNSGLRIVPIGRPIANTQIYILDEARQPVPPGVAGELHIGGAGLARGYLNQPELTAERFIPHPFSDKPDARLYRTGDLARWLPDGNIEFLGRMDQQVKIRGFRIELGEIESALCTHPALRDSAVSARTDGMDETCLTAFVVPREALGLTVHSLRKWLGEKLPAYMIPSRFVSVPALPLNPNGKLDRKALEKLGGEALASGTDYVAPRNEWECALAEIWQAVLHRERIGIQDNFFNLGGHSLLAAVICSHVNRRLGIEVSLLSIFDHPTIEGLAKQMASTKDHQQKLHPIEKADREKSLPMSFAQQGMWLLQQTLSDTVTYNEPVAWRLSGRVDREKIRRALQAILERHEVLRTALVQEEGNLVQQIAAAKEVPLPWREVDLPAVPTDQKEEVLGKELLEEARRPFDLAQAPLWRAVWIELTADEQVLAFTFHHSIVDEWSMRLFFQELERLYAANGQIELAGLPELPVQYPDYAAWQRQRLAGKFLETSRNYWREQLGDLPPALELPADKMRPRLPSGRGAVHDFRLTGKIASGLRELAREEGTTTFTVMLAAFQVWLHRYTGQTDLIVGAPVADRERPEVQALLGYFLNTLPIRTRLEGSRNFREVVQQVRATLLVAFEHSDLPFEQMVELAVKERKMGQEPLYQVMLVLLEEGLPPLRLDQAQSRLMPMRTGTSKNNLTLSIQAVGEAWDCQLEYATDLFTADRAARMARHLTELLRSIVKDTEEPISQLNLMPEAERHQILVEWNRTERDYPRDKCVHQLFEEQVERTPDAVAVVFEGNSLSYRELNVRANQLAHHLRSLGVGPDVLVGLCAERSLEMAVAVLGILKAGGAYVPLDPALPQQRLVFLMSDAACAVVVVQHSLLPLLKRDSQADEPSPPLVVLDAMTLDLVSEEGENPIPIAAPNHLAYVLYTSGSTGQPKGVEMPHRALVNLIHWQCSTSAATGSSRTLQFASLGFDVSFQEMFSTWMSGGTLVLIADEVRKDPVALLATMVAGRIDRVFLPFVMLELLAETAGKLETFPADLKEVAVAGEQLRIGSGIRNFFSRMPNCRLWNHYGPAEAHVVTSHEMVGAASGWPDLPPIGRPLPNCQIYLLDAQLNPVLPGIVGELHIGGVCLSRGYRQRPDLTSERFIPHPFSSSPGARLYRTGDLARWLPDGDIEYIGRMDHQVKIRGHRIELGEIEAVLSGHPEVSACAVVAQDHSVGDKKLAAFVVNRQEALSVDSLRQWLAEKLPDYMIPSRFVAVPSLPLNPNGKLDRKALEKLDGVELASGTDYAAPRNERERELAEIWQAVLRREKIGIHDNFFNLGGHSLLAAVLCSQIHCRLGMEISLLWIFEYPTVSRLAKQLASMESQKQNLHPITKADRTKPLLMSFAQQRMWLLRQTLPDPAVYNQPMAWRLSGRVDREKLCRALQAILERHEVLRTALVQLGADLVQQIASANEVPLPWQEMDLRATPPNQKEEVLARCWLEEARRPFDLAQAPLWRAMWIILAADEHVLMFTFHHSIVDDWSLKLFSQELERLYAADGQIELAGLPELPVQYADYAAWRRQLLAGERLETQRHYWQEQLRDLPVALELPANRTRPLLPSGRGAVHEFRLTGPVVSSLRELAREEGATNFMLMLAAFQVWLHRYTGQTDVVVGTPFAKREQPEWQSLLGFFLNTLPIRARLDGIRSFREVVHQVRATVLGALEHSDLPFEQMVALAVKKREAGNQPLFQAMFVLLEEGLPPLRLDQVQSRLVPMSTGTSKSDLTLSVQAAGETWDCQLEYATDLFTAETAARMARHLTELFRSIAENPQEPISQLRLMPEAERRQILVEWNRTERDYPRDKCVHQLFEEQAERTPEAAAVVFEGNSLAYRELNIRANRLAHHLRKLGVGPDALVGLCVERSIEMVVALLGILKAGGAYWALEENLPEERIRLMLADAQPRVLLVRRKSVKHLSSLAGKTPADPPTGAITVAAIEDLLASSPEGIIPDAPPNQAGDPAYVSYTSGSTGRPKGVVVPHRGVVRLVKGADYVSLNAEDVLLHLSPLSFDASTFEIWGALLNGGRVVLMPPGPPALAEIGEAIRRHRVTTLWLTAGLFHLMVDERLDDLKPLRQLLSGGDVLSPERVRKAFHALPGCRIINGYGPTENTTFTCCYPVKDERGLTPTVPIGRPIANTQVYVLDSHQHPVPVGVAGELYAGGDGVACGYLHQPQLTAERFVPDPFSGKPDARLYRTGDLARWLPDGNIEFLGRMDQQVKIRGFRIELGEIETVLCVQPEVREATTIVREDKPGDKRLVAYLVAKTGEKPDVLTLRARLAEKLPDYMIPAAFVWLDQLPLTPNGKVDRKALPAPEIIGGGTPSENKKPVNLLELELIRIWRRLFQREDIGRQDNFFALGGHSLLAARLAAEIDKLLKCKLPVAALFQSPTIESLARRLADDNWAPPWSSLVPLQTLGSKPPLFLAHGIGGDVYGFLGLIKLLPPDQPCYGIQAVGLDGKSARHVTVEEMAAYYVREIVSFQPDGPFYLAGHSLGGQIAFEIARQLHSVGRRVAFLALLDCVPVSKIPWFLYGLSMITYIPSRCLSHFRRWWQLPRHERLNYLRGRWSALRFWMNKNLSKPPPVTASPPLESQPPQFPGFYDYYHAVAFAHRLRPYPGPADVFYSDEICPEWRNWYWRYFARGGISCHQVPGGHLEILLSPDHFPALAQSLMTVLQSVQEKERAAASRDGDTHANPVL